MSSFVTVLTRLAVSPTRISSNVRFSTSSASVLSMFPSQGTVVQYGSARSRPTASRPGEVSSPAEIQADIAEVAARIVQDLGTHLVAERPQMLLPEVECVLGKALEALRPVRFEIVDSATAVRQVA